MQHYLRKRIRKNAWELYSKLFKKQEKLNGEVVKSYCSILSDDFQHIHSHNIAHTKKKKR
jgi:hypothetical protein